MSDIFKFLGVMFAAIVAYVLTTLFCGWLISRNDDTEGLFATAAWSTGAILYAATIAFMLFARP